MYPLFLSFLQIEGRMLFLNVPLPNPKKVVGGCIIFAKGNNGNLLPLFELTYRLHEVDAKQAGVEHRHRPSIDAHGVDKAD